ncbi:hypothetical protein NUW54_g13806 [Trametes sanguinea]|uniref:Uncharacterized protein n=1 Tax=Trametes sanguinea TaxID=158606 RepID=A0ACC1MJB8_9APHY|nr:hypothetical protein NUW54_g13806 [Trametes sanguinea]
MGVEGEFVPKVVVLRHNVVDDAVYRKRALEDGRSSGLGVALVIHGDSSPSKFGLAWRIAQETRGVLAQAVGRSVGGDHFTPVCPHRFAHDGFRAREDRLTVGSSRVVVYARSGMDEMVIRAEVKVERLVVCGQSKAERVCVA